MNIRRSFIVRDGHIEITVAETVDHKGVLFRFGTYDITISQETAKVIADLIDDKYRGSYVTDYIRYSDHYDFKAPEVVTTATPAPDPEDKLLHGDELP